MPLIYKFSLVCTLLLNAISIAMANPVDFYYQNQQTQPAPDSIQTGTISQLLNYKKPQKGSFKQVYYLDESYGPNNDAPVFFYICGQYACNKNVLTGAIREYAQLYHAKLVALEHRYYGTSIPVANLSTKEMRFLKTEAVLGDLSSFQNQISKEKNWTGKWIAFGGGYAGALAAYYRLQYPNQVAGAVASSAPVAAKNDFYEYDQRITELAGVECAQAIREVVYEVESSLSDKQRLAHLKAVFNATLIANSIDFLNLIADIAASSIQNGAKDKFCNALLAGPTPMQAYAQFAKDLYKEMHVAAYALTPQGALSVNIQDFNHGFGLRQWYYQSCTEYGDWQTASPNPFLSTRSILINTQYRKDVCRRLFGITTPANTDLINNNYYLPLRSTKASNIHFTNGDLDAWSYLSLTQANGNADNPQLFYSTITNGAYCHDLKASATSDSKSLTQVRNMTKLLSQEWIVGCSKEVYQ